MDQLVRFGKRHLAGPLGFTRVPLPPSGTPSARRRCGWTSSSSTTTPPGPQPRAGLLESKGSSSAACALPVPCLLHWVLMVTSPAVGNPPALFL